MKIVVEKDLLKKTLLYFKETGKTKTSIKEISRFLNVRLNPIILEFIHDFKEEGIVKDIQIGKPR